MSQFDGCFNNLNILLLGFLLETNKLVLLEGLKYCTAQCADCNCKIDFSKMNGLVSKIDLPNTKQVVQVSIKSQPL